MSDDFYSFSSLITHHLSPITTASFLRADGDEDGTFAGARDEEEQRAVARALDGPAQVFDRADGLAVRLLD
jgi:hypothetical protein